MERELNKKFLNGNYVVTGVGVKLLHHALVANPLDNNRSQRIGRFILMFNDMEVATNGNILITKSGMFEPCSLTKLQEISGLKERAFRTFRKELQEKHYIKIEEGIIYVNPLFAMATDLDYIREGLINKFPRYKNYFDIINEDLLS
jgi:hypothetical protein